MSRERVDRLQRAGLAVGIVALGLALLGAVAARPPLFQAYLVGYLLWLGLALGSLAVLMLHRQTGGAWGDAIREPLEAAVRTLPFLALFFIPLLLGLPDIYPWASPGGDHHGARGVYLAVPFFVVRAVIYFAIWIGLGILAVGPPRRADAWSAPGLVLFGLTLTFASIDWIMSLDPHWFSTIFGLKVIVGQVLGALAAAIVVRVAILGQPTEALVLRDLGNLLLAFVMLWAYLSFSQLLIIWSGDLPEEIGWYLPRLGAWAPVSVTLLVIHFAIPLPILLARGAKQRAAVLASLAGLILVARWVDTLWLVRPTLEPGRIRLGWMDLAVTAGIGGVWLAALAAQLRGRRAIPAPQPRPAAGPIDREQAHRHA